MKQMLRPHKGSSETRRRKSCTACAPADFDPTRVRLKPVSLCSSSAAIPNFDPTMVRLEHSSGRTTASATTRFDPTRVRLEHERVRANQRQCGASTPRGFVWNRTAMA